jgi:Na+-transporting methylmalonyl-CoA/oxaloacetate decarboxylase gamma subunit
MDLTVLIVLVGFVLFALTLIFLGTMLNKRKKATDEPEGLRDQVTPKSVKKTDSKKPSKEKERYFTNKIIVSSDVSKMQYQGSTPFIELDENWQQMPLERTILEVAREILTRMFPLAYLAGKLSVMEQGTKVGMVMIVLFILVIANLGLTYIKTDSNSAKIDSMNSNFTNIQNNMNAKLDNQGALIQVIGQKMNVTGNSTIITVGG